MAKLYLLDTQQWCMYQHQLLSVLSSDEKAEIARYHREEDRLRSTLGRAAVRWLLSELLHTHPSDIKIHRNPFGKPYIEDARVWFNTSHSGDVVAVAISQMGVIGVDVESVSRHSCGMAIADRFFHASEAERLRNTPEEQFSEHFAKLWTGKEAIVKASGAGIAYGLDSAVIDENWKAANGEYDLYWFVPKPGYQGAVAVQPNDELTDRLWRLPCQWPTEWTTQVQF